MGIAFSKITSGIDVSELRAQLEAQPELFGEFGLRKTFPGTPHSEMDDIWVRYAPPNRGLETGDWSYFNEPHDSVWYPVVHKIPAVMQIIFRVMAEVFGERLGGVLITKLPAGKKIKRHTDEGWHASYYDKYFIPIKNAKGASFGFDEGAINPDEGDLWGFDNSYPHWVDNDSNDERIAMIVCVKQSFLDRSGLCLGE